MKLRRKMRFHALQAAISLRRCKRLSDWQDIYRHTPGSIPLRRAATQNMSAPAIHLHYAPRRDYRDAAGVASLFGDFCLPSRRRHAFCPYFGIMSI